MRQDLLGERAGYDLSNPGSSLDPEGTHPEIPANVESNFNVNPDRPIHMQVLNNSPKTVELDVKNVGRRELSILAINGDTLDFEDKEDYDILQQPTPIKVRNYL